MRGRILLAVVVMIAVPPSACSRSNRGAGSGANVTAVPRSSTTSTSTTTAPVAGLGSADEAAKHLYSAWVAGDRVEALRFASRPAVDAVFATAYSPPGWKFRGCDHPASGASSCFFAYQGGGANVIADRSPAGGFIVTRVDFIAD